MTSVLPDLSPLDLDADPKGCCARLYESDAVRWLLDNQLHPVVQPLAIVAAEEIVGAGDVPVKKHVGILETVDLMITAKVGRARACRLGPAQLENATGWIDAYRRAWERRLDRFGAYVEERR